MLGLRQSDHFKEMNPVFVYMPDWYLLILIARQRCDRTINETAAEKKSTAEDDDDGIVQIREEKKNKF